MTPIAHAAVGLLGWKYSGQPRGRRALWIFIFLACAVDLDFFLYYVFGRPVIFSHQLYSHNIFITLAVTLPFFLFINGAGARLGLVITSMSHLFLDVFVIDTVPPIGFRPFFPLFNKFLAYGFFPYVVRDTWADVFSLRNVFAVGCEILCFVIPAAILCRRELVDLLARPRARTIAR